MNTRRTATNTTARPGRRSRAAARPHSPVLRLSTLMLSLLGAFAPLQQAWALPTGEQVVAGTVSVSRPTATVLDIHQGSQRAIVNWTSFSSAAGETINIAQPGRDAVLLSRVVGSDPSQLFGSLNANGQLYLINPAGVYFAPGASVNVGGLVASTLGLSDADFLAGGGTFARDGAAGAIRNDGDIRAAEGGYVAFFAPKIDNAGSITAEGGSVALAAGDRVTLALTPRGLINVSVDAATLGAQVSHSGHIEADGGTVLLSARSADAVMDTVLNVSGVVRARTAVERDGVIVLEGAGSGVVAVSGTLDARGDDAGETGGTVKVLGERVALTGSAGIDASGAAGGGTVLVGGNWQGGGAERNALATYVADGARIDASATDHGDGGTVVVWADGSTRYYGSIAARGGDSGGNGGRVEVSGKTHLDFAGGVDTSAAQGDTGMLLLDPATLTILASHRSATTPPTTFTDTVGNNGISANAFEDVSTGGSTLFKNDLLALAATNDVYLTATESITFGSVNGDVAYAGTSRTSLNNASTTSGTKAIAFMNEGDGKKSLSIKTNTLDLNDWTISARSISIDAAAVTTTDARLEVDAPTTDNRADAKLADGGVLTFVRDTAVSGPLTLVRFGPSETTQVEFEVRIASGATVDLQGGLARANNRLTGIQITSADGSDGQGGTLQIKGGGPAEGFKYTGTGTGANVTFVGDSSETALKLTNTANDFNVLTLSGNWGGVEVKDANALTLTGGNATSLITTSGALTFGGGTYGTVNATVSGALTFGGGTYGTVAATVSGNVTQTGAVTVTGVTTLKAKGTPARTATLDKDNDFSSVVLTADSGASWSNVTLTDKNALTVSGDAGTLTTTSGDLKFGGGTYGSVAATVSGNVTQSGAVTVNGTGTDDKMTLTATGGERTASLITSGNYIKSLELVKGTSGSWTSATLNNGTNALTVKGDAGTLTTTSGDLKFGGGTYGSVAATVSGNVTQTGAVTVTGAMKLTATDDARTADLISTQVNNIKSLELAATDGKGSWSSATVDNGTNALTVKGDAGTLTTTSGDLSFGGGTYTTVNATFTGDLTQSAAVTAPTLNLTHSATSSITLTNTGNDFTDVNLKGDTTTDGAMVTTRAVGGIDIVEKSGLNLNSDSGASLIANGEFKLKSGGNITLNSDVTATPLIEIESTGGSLTLQNLTATGSDSAIALTAKGAISAQNITADSVYLDGDSLGSGTTVEASSLGMKNGAVPASATGVKTIAYSGGNFTWTQTDDLVIGTVTAGSKSVAGVNSSGNVSLSTGGNLTQTEAMVVTTGKTTVLANSVKLDNQANDFKTLQLGRTDNGAVRVSDATIRDKNALTISDSNVASLSVKTNGDLNVANTGALAFNADAGSGKSVTVTTSGALTINGDVKTAKGAGPTVELEPSTIELKASSVITANGGKLSANLVKVFANAIGSSESPVLIDFDQTKTASDMRVQFGNGSQGRLTDTVFFGNGTASAKAPPINFDGKSGVDKNVVWNGKSKQDIRTVDVVGATQGLANFNASDLRAQAFGSRSLVTRVQNGQVLAEAVTKCADDGANCETTSNALALGPLPPAIDDIADGGLGLGDFVALQPGDLTGLPESTASGDAEKPEAEAK